MKKLLFRERTLSNAIIADRTGSQALRGTELDLSIGAQAVNFTGFPAMATAIAFRGASVIRYKRV
jgi:hypothetical protein